MTLVNRSWGMGQGCPLSPLSVPILPGVPASAVTHHFLTRSTMILMHFRLEARNPLKALPQTSQTCHFSLLTTEPFTWLVIPLFSLTCNQLLSSKSSFSSFSPSITTIFIWNVLCRISAKTAKSPRSTYSITCNLDKITNGLLGINLEFHACL